MSDEQAIFRFDIRETVYFQEGSQVSELRNIELTPDVSIRETGDYVAIKGTLNLQGTYRPIESHLHEADVSVPEVETRRYVEEVRQLSADESSFGHKFPIEVAVPEERITSIDDVSVGVETFDYEIAANDKLSITSTIHITGILTEEQNRDASEQTAQNEQDEEAHELANEHAIDEQNEAVRNYREEDSLVGDEHDQSDSGDSFTFNMSYDTEGPVQLSPIEELYELEKEEEKARAEAPNVQIQSQGTSEESSLSNDGVDENETEEVVDARHSVDLEEVAQETSPTNETDETAREQDFVASEDERSLSGLEEYETVETHNVDNEFIEPDVHEELVTTTDSRHEYSAEEADDLVLERSVNEEDENLEHEEVRAENEESSEDEKSSKRKKRTTTLANVLAKKSAKEKAKREEEQQTSEEDLEETAEGAVEEQDTIPYNDLAAMFSNEVEESYSSVRLYIVQERDTLETIAGRYEIPVSRILQYNRLISEDLGAGQLIYIPYHKESKEN